MLIREQRISTAASPTIFSKKKGKIMALIEKTIVDQIEFVGPFKHVQVRQDKQIVDDTTDEVKVSGQWHRYVLRSSDDISDQPSDVQAVANAVWTDEVKAAWAADQLERNG